MSLLFSHPDQAFYLREVVERTGLGVGHVQRELARLVEGTVINRRRQGRHVYFQANDKCPVFAELKGLVTKTMGIAGALRQALSPLGDQIDIAFVFGSVAHGEHRESSDVDLMVIGEVTFAQVVGAVRSCEAELGREINPTLFPSPEFRTKVASKNHFLNTVLKAPKVFILGNEDELGDLLP